MASTIQIKRTNTGGKPSELQYGELAYVSTDPSTNSDGHQLYIGTTPYANGLAQVIQPIGGQYYTDKLDHSIGTLTANSAVLVDNNKKIDEWYIDDIKLDGTTISVEATNANLTITANGSGSINLGNTTVSTLTAGRMVFAGTDKILTDDANLTFGSNELQIGNSTVGISAYTNGTLEVSSLTSGRVTFATTNGRLTDTANVTVTETQLLVGNSTVGVTIYSNGSLDATGTLTYSGTSDSSLANNRLIFVNNTNEHETQDSLKIESANSTYANVTFAGDISLNNIEIDSSSANKITVSNTNGNIELEGNGTGIVDFTADSQVKLPVGNTTVAETGAAGHVRYDNEKGVYVGHDGTDWTVLSGLSDVDQDTRITTETTSGGDQDTLSFFAGSAVPLMVANSTAVQLTANSTHNPYLQAGEIKVQNNVISSTNTNIYLNPLSGDANNVLGKVIVQGDLQVDGVTTTVNSTEITVDDPIMTLGGDTAPAADDNKDRGIIFRYHTGAEAKIGFFGYDDSNTEFVFIEDATDTSSVLSGGKGTARFGSLRLEGKVDVYANSQVTSNGQILISGGDGFEANTIATGNSVVVSTANGALTIYANNAQGQATHAANGDPSDDNSAELGVASFASEQFTVSSGHVSIQDSTAVATANAAVGNTQANAENFSAVGVASFASEQFAVDGGHVTIISIDGGSY